MSVSLLLLTSMLIPTVTSLLALNYKCTIKQEHRQAWLTQIRDDQLCTRHDEPGNIQFVVGQDVDDENVFHLHEEFVSLAAFQDHCASPHFQRYADFLETHKPMVGEPQICFYRPLEELEYEKTTRSIHKNTFGLNVNLYPKASVRDEFLNVISNNKKGTDSTEELALQYTYGESVAVEGMAEGVANTFHFHEQYAGKDHGKEGFDAHTTAPHFAAWEDFVGTNPFEKEPEVFKFRIVEP